MIHHQLRLGGISSNGGNRGDPGNQQGHSNKSYLHPFFFSQRVKSVMERIVISNICHYYCILPPQSEKVAAACWKEDMCVAVHGTRFSICYFLSIFSFMLVLVAQQSRQRVR
jgi:hypothetical protein